MDELRLTAPQPTARDRRAPAPHPGPQIARDYLEPLGLDAEAFAGLIGMDGRRFASMLAGTASLDVDAAVRIGRALGLPADRLMDAQTHHDFEISRAVEHLMPTPPTNVLADRAFPSDATHGHLARTAGAESHEMLYFVADADGASNERDLERAHKIRVGDRLRVYDRDGRIVWTGPVLADLDGHWLFAFAKRPTWEAWFAGEARAEFVTQPIKD